MLTQTLALNLCLVSCELLSSFGSGGQMARHSSSGSGILSPSMSHLAVLYQELDPPLMNMGVVSICPSCHTRHLNAASTLTKNLFKRGYTLICIKATPTPSKHSLQNQAPLRLPSHTPTTSPSPLLDSDWHFSGPESATLNATSQNAPPLRANTILSATHPQ